jgi:hypothetical protein
MSAHHESDKPHGPGMTELLKELLEDAPEPKVGEPEPKILLDDLLSRFQRRAFGVYLLIVVLPAFVAVAFGIGAVSGVLSILCGLQMMLGLERPWLPKFAKGFGLPRRAIASFTRRTESWFRWLEKLIKPRMPQFTTRKADVFSGFIVLTMGIALSLPVPLTNFIFAVPLTVLAFALIERDGRTLLICWISSIVIMIAFGVGLWLLGSGFMHWVFGLFS